MYLNTIKNICISMLLYTSISTNLYSDELNNISSKDTLFSNDSVINEIYNVNNNQKLSLQDKKNILSKILLFSSEFEKKYDFSILDYPKSNSINDQINNILNSNLKELGKTQSLSLYDKVHKNFKGENFDLKYYNLMTNVEDEISNILDVYNKNVIIQNKSVYNVAYNISNEDDDDNTLTLDTNDCSSKNHKQYPFTNNNHIVNKLDVLNLMVSKTNVLDSIDFFVNEEFNLFSIYDKEILQSYQIITDSINLISNDSSFDYKLLNFLLVKQSILKDESLKIINSTLSKECFIK